MRSIERSSPRSLRTVTLLGLLLAGGCGRLVDLPPGRSLWGAANLQRYVAIGNSVTMGVLDGALLEAGSECSYPALLAGQARVPDFEIPRVSGAGVVAFPPNEVGVVDGGRMVVTSLAPLTIERAPAGVPLNQDLPRPYDNLGVSNALLAEALDVRGASTSLIGNTLFDLIFRGNGTWLDQITERDATFLTLWLGNNDVLIWAGAGGDDALAPGLPVPVPAFAQVYGALLDGLLAVTDQVVLFNLPDLTTLPVFTTIPPFVLDPATAQPVTDPDGELIPLVGPDGPLEPLDLVLLTASAALMAGDGIPVALGGSGTPLADAHVLSGTEQATARAAMEGYNQAIRAEADAHDLAIVDIAGLLQEVATGGVTEDGETLTDDYLTGGAFGLDGVHPTCKGYGLIANRLVEVINERYQARIPRVRIDELEGVVLPAPLAVDASAVIATARRWRVPHVVGR
jgi:hypothetical protein